MVYNENSKTAIYKWRATHQEEYKAYQRIKAREHYEKNKEELRRKKLAYYYRKNGKQPKLKPTSVIADIKNENKIDDETM